MNMKEVVKIAMAKNDIDGIMQLVEVTGVSHYICTKALKNDKTIKLGELLTIIEALGYQLKAELIK